MNTRQVYLSAIQRMGLIVLALHIPLFGAAGAWFGTGPLLGVLLGTLIFLGPWLISRAAPATELVSVMVAIALVSDSAVLVHLGRGMIEMHFHFFVAGAMLCVFASPWPVLAAVATIALHHLSFYLLLPASVFNYEASFSIVFLHAAFVIAEAIPVLYVSGIIARLVGAQEGFTEISKRILNGAEQMVSNSHLLASSVEQQAQATHETVSALEEITASLGATFSNAQESVVFSSEVKESVKKGQGAVLEMVTNLNQIRTGGEVLMKSIDHSFARFGELSQMISNIATKTKVINDIVFQTKLLSFNASVEAARAGEAGKGFAVVAEEVGKLAQMSGSSAKDIEQTLQGNLKTVQDIMIESRGAVQELMLGEATKTQEGADLGRRCGKELETVVFQTLKFAQMVEQIAAATKEQSSGINQIRTAISEIERSTQAASSIAQESEKFADVLRAEANRLAGATHGILGFLGRTAKQANAVEGPAQPVSEQESEAA